MSRTPIANAAMAAVTAALLSVPAPALADWPERPIRLIVPFGPGGGGDVLGRILGDALRERLDTPFVVENIPGASTTIGVTALVGSEPDGYTLGIVNVSSTVIAPATMSNITYDPIDDLTYIAFIAGAPTVIAVNAELGITTIEELLEASRTASPPLAYGTQGTATMSNLPPVEFFREAGVTMQHVPYGGAGAAVVDAVAGHTQFVASTLTTARAQIDAGTLVPLLISSPNRHPDFPDVPTYAEIGYPHLSSTVWYGLVGPAGLDPEIVSTLNAAVLEVLEIPAVVAPLVADGFLFDPMTPEEFLAFQQAQAEIFGPVAAAMVTQ